MVMVEVVVCQRNYQGREQERQEEEEWKRRMTTRNLNWYQVDLEVVGFDVEEEDETEEVELVEFHHCRNSMACESWHLLALS